MKIGMTVAFLVVFIVPVLSHSSGASSYVKINLPTLSGYSYSWAKDINDSGQSVGNSSNVDTDNEACLWQNGTVADLGKLPGYNTSQAAAINNMGQIAGTSYRSNIGMACLWQNGSVTALGTLTGDNRSWAVGINNNGMVVGGSLGTNGQVHACLWQNGTAVSLGTPTMGVNSYAIAVNDYGQVVGYASNSSNTVYSAWLWQNGAITDLGMGWAYGINNAGQTVGSSGGFQACLWQPVPEPSSILSLLCGIGGLGGIMWRRGK